MSLSNVKRKRKKMEVKLFIFWRKCWLIFVWNKHLRKLKNYNSKIKKLLWIKSNNSNRKRLSGLLSIEEYRGTGVQGYREKQFGKDAGRAKKRDFRLMGSSFNVKKNIRANLNLFRIISHIIYLYYEIKLVNIF